LARTAEGEQFGAARALSFGITSRSALASGVLSGTYSRAVRTVKGSSRSGYAAPNRTEDSALTEPTLEYPMNVIRTFATGFLQGDTTINGLSSTAFARA
jgi:aryl-alcohol dehydrogenase-like predicted oxidoreductase